MIMLHGRRRSFVDLEALLIHRNATHFLDTSAGDTPLSGHALSFVPVIDTLVERNNLSAGEATPIRWRLYALERAHR
jgi:hypothetical protein